MADRFAERSRQLLVELARRGPRSRPNSPQSRQHLAGLVGQAVPPFATIGGGAKLDEPSSLHQRQRLRHGRLREAQTSGELADRQVVAILQQCEIGVVAGTKVQCFRAIYVVDGAIQCVGQDAQGRAKSNCHP